MARSPNPRRKLPCSYGSPSTRYGPWAGRSVGEVNETPTPDLQASIEAGHPNPGDIALLKVQASETMEFCAREAMHVLGGIGYMRGSRVERIYREVRVNAIGGGSEAIMREHAARQYGL